METLNDLVTRLEHSHSNSSLLKDLNLIQGNEQYNYIKWEGLSNNQNLNDLVFQYEQAPSPSITCGILTYNEERCIKRCLDSLGNQFDEILVLDSHSTDNTTKIINRDFPRVKVVYEPWIDDFSFHRNKLVSLTSSEWIYFIDADNYCVDSTNKFKRVAKLIQFLSIDCIISPMIKEHIGHVYTDNRKMFSVKKGIQFKGKVHEEPINADGSIPQNITVDILICHDGYNPEVINLSEKNDRNIKLTRQMMEEEPSNPKWLYFYARELHYAREETHIIETLLIKAIDLYKQSTYKRYQPEAILLL
ncbi:SunS family peptide S-glycosyltransferase, partial [Bacillus toyonensis]